MPKIYSDFFQLIGNTPLLHLNKYAQNNNLCGNIFAKLEYLNPAGSVKDRVGLNMIEDAEKRGVLKPGSVIIEPTSGNTGIGLAAVASVKGYRVILTMPETMSIERRKLLAAYGAELVLTDGSKSMQGAIEKARELANEIPGSYIPSQFENPSNPAIHYNTTAPEIYDSLEGELDFFVAGVGTGGTITGCAKYFKEHNRNIKIIAVEPYDSAVISGEEPGSHMLQGLGAGFIPDILDTSLLDEIIKIKNEQAYKAARQLVKYEGILTGISSGAALFAAGMIAERIENKGKNIVVLLPDTGDRYLSTPLY